MVRIWTHPDDYNIYRVGVGALRDVITKKMVGRKIMIDNGPRKDPERNSRNQHQLNKRIIPLSSAYGSEESFTS